jgi:di/tricarboxylate transporter
MDELLGRRYLRIEDEEFTVESLTSTEVHLVEVVLLPQFPHLGATLRQIQFRSRYGGIVLAIWRDGQPLRTSLDDVSLQAQDVLLVQTTSQQLEQYRANPDLEVSTAEHASVYRLHERLLAVRIPPESSLAGKTLAESRLAEAFGLAVLGILRDGETRLMLPADERLQAGDQLLVKGKPEVLSALQGLQDLEVDSGALPRLTELETDAVGLVEMVLSPHTTLVDRTLRELHFREKFGLSVLSIWREGQAYHTDLSEMPLRFGDALLLFGPRDRLRLLGAEPDFLPVSGEIQEAPLLARAPLAGLIMIAVVASVLLGWLPISIAAVAGSALMVLTGCLSMEEAYRFIDWRAVFLIAGMLPLGIAMETSGAARFLADNVMLRMAGMGPLALIFGLFALTNLASQIMPNPVVTVLMAPIAINSALNLGLSPQALMMVVALAASASFLSPVGHPANVLVMGPGGYKFTDYVRVGLPLSLVVMVITLLVVPIFWPL